MGILLYLTNIAYIIFAFVQPDPGGDPNGIPITEGIIFLLTTGIGLGIRTLYKKKK